MDSPLLSEAIFAAASAPPTRRGLHWVAVRNSAIALAESGTLLMTGSCSSLSATLYGWPCLRGLVHPGARGADRGRSQEQRRTLEGRRRRLRDL